MAREIPLSKGKVAIVDDDDFERLNRYRWCFSYGYAKRGVWNGKYKTRSEFMHHRVLPRKKGLYIDHINRNKLDNRKCNLRYVNKNQNSLNIGLQKNNTSGFTGVKFKNDQYRTKPWCACIKVNYKVKTLGHFKTKEEAAVVAKTAREKQWDIFNQAISQP